MEQSVRAASTLAIRRLLAGELESSCYRQEFDSLCGRAGYCDTRYARVGGYLVIFCTEAMGNPGMSITNSAPAPWEAASDDVAGHDESVIWVEHSAPVREGDAHRFDLIEVRAGRLRWTPLSLATAAA